MEAAIASVLASSFPYFDSMIPVLILPEEIAVAIAAAVIIIAAATAFEERLSSPSLLVLLRFSKRRAYRLVGKEELCLAWEVAVKRKWLNWNGVKEELERSRQKE